MTQNQPVGNLQPDCTQPICTDKACQDSTHEPMQFEKFSLLANLSPGRIVGVMP